MSFENLNLHPKILKALKDAGYVSPTSIQRDAIPLVLNGNDLRASAQTGTGKTGAFLLPALNRLIEPSDKEGHGPRVLILVPTRELAMQVAAESVKYSKYLSRMKTVCIYGGAPYPLQNRELSRPYEILVATPGRLIDHFEQKRINFSRVEMFILDEADRMLDMGFIGDVERLSAALPKTVQTLMFSATLKGTVMNLSKKLLKNPVEVSVEPDKLQKANIQQFMYQVDGLPHKLRILDHLLQDQTWDQTIIFTSTKRYAEQLVEILQDNGHEAAALHGDMNQRKRTSTIAQLRKGKTKILVATDVAARGIDVPAISHVINFDLPMSEEDYVHRIGRTGRAEAKGIAITFVSPQDFMMIKKIEGFIEQPIIPQVIAGMEPTLKPSTSAPRKRGRPGGGSRGGNSSGGAKRRFGEKSSGFGEKKGGFGERKGGFGERKAPSSSSRFSRDEPRSRARSAR